MTGEGIVTLEVLKSKLSQSRIVREALPARLADGEVLFKVDGLALTANNISYAHSGDQLGYWNFFPTGDGWGRIPGVGWGTVIKSAHPRIAEGAKCWGFFPYASHHKILADHAGKSGFTDISPNRQNHAPVYTRFEFPSAYPAYEAAREDQDSLLRGLFGTAWLLEDFFAMHGYFGAEHCIVTSASSKTGIALAHSVKSRGQVACIGLTSQANLQFCKGLGCYDAVLTYDAVTTLDQTTPAVMADFTGNIAIIASLHHHFMANMKHSARVGDTHHLAAAPPTDLPGTRPKFFFAPKQVEIRNAELGADHVAAMLFEAYRGFRIFCDGWLDVKRIQGEEAVVKAYDETFAGRLNPAAGLIVSF